MTALEQIVSKLSEEASLGASRREFIKVLLATGGAIILASFGVDTTRASNPNSAPEAECGASGLCTIPCDTRAFCLQRAYHHNTSECSGSIKESCPTQTCPPIGLPGKIIQYCKQTCRRCCEPNKCKFGSWTITKSCVSCENQGNDQCLSCSGNCPSSPSQRSKSLSENT